MQLCVKLIHSSFSTVLYISFVPPDGRHLCCSSSPLPFQFLPDLHLLVLELTPILHVNLKGFKICVWSGGSKFPFGDDLQGWCPCTGICK